MDQVYLKCALAVAVAADVGSIVNITVSSATVTVIAAVLDTACVINKFGRQKDTRLFVIDFSVVL